MTQTVLITGATSGFGAAGVRRFAKAGWRVVATGRRADRLKALVEELGARTVHASVFDVGDEKAIDAVCRYRSLESIFSSRFSAST